MEVNGETMAAQARPARHPALEPGRLGTLDLRNRVIRTAAFEGMCPGGAPSSALVEHHRALARGGVAMTTVAYCAVSPDGRTYGHQMLMREEIVPALRELTAAVHAEGARASIQLGHCGDFSNRSVIGGRPIGPSRRFVLYGLSFSRAMDASDIRRVTDDFGRAAALAREAGFDAVELHAGHGYLLSQFLSPAVNRRRDAYGGSLEGRMRLSLEVLDRVRRDAGADFPVLVKTNLEDGFAGGLGIDEAVEVARALERGGAAALVLSGGFVSRTPLYMMRGDVPVREMASVQPGIARRIGLRLFGHLFVQTYRFEDLFFLPLARRVRAATRLPLVLLGGVRSAAGMRTAMEEGFEFVALGRALVMDPDLVRKLEVGAWQESACDRCNRCIAEMDAGGVRCPCADELLSGRA